jgi:putative DNA primase/helicase
MRFEADERYERALAYFERRADAAMANGRRAESPRAEAPSTWIAPLKREEAEAPWPAPRPLAAELEPEPYPVDALPSRIRGAVEEVQAFVQAPVAMVASSALAALSVAVQAHVDVERSSRLTGPTSLYLLALGSSGERKSTCDSFFVSALRQYEQEQAEAMAPEVQRYKAEQATWEAKREGILLAIKAAAKAGEPCPELEAELLELERSAPVPPRVPRLLLGDETPEALAWHLAKVWPASAVMSSEAGTVFGSHAMNRDTIMRNLALLNVLWEGGEHVVGRRTSESFTVRGARLSVALLVQPETLREFFAKSGALVRGIGFLARFLICWPPSTQGTRFFKEPPQHWPALAAFHRRIAEILALPVPMDDKGSLTPRVLPLSQEAKAAWIEYHDAIEAELGAGGELHAVGDVAARSAENAARLAALFHVFDHGIGPIGLDAFLRASRITAWHLHEARRFFGELAMPAEMADAARLDAWLVAHCRRERVGTVPTRDAQRLGPVRDKERLGAALQELEELSRVRVIRADRRRLIEVNPALLEGEA